MVNHLAHLYLAKNNKDLLIGNFIADAVKGRQIETFSKGIQKGIVMHRAIDTFTDSHDVVKKSIIKFRPQLHKYAGIAVDVVYDHFLAKNWSDYHHEPLQDYAAQMYDLLNENSKILPLNSQRFLFYMTSRNMLFYYQELAHLQMVFNGMSKRSKFTSGLEKSVEILESNYLEIEAEFKEFFESLCEYISNEYPANLE